MSGSALTAEKQKTKTMDGVLTKSEVLQLLQADLPESVAARTHSQEVFRSCVVLTTLVRYQNNVHFNNGLKEGNELFADELSRFFETSNSQSSEASVAAGYSDTKVVVISGRLESPSTLEQKLQAIKSEVKENQRQNVIAASAKQQNKGKASKLDLIVLLVQTQISVLDLHTFSPLIDLVLHFSVENGTLIKPVEDQMSVFNPCVGDEVLLVDQYRKANDDPPKDDSISPDEGFLAVIESIDADTGFFTVKINESNTIESDVPFSRLRPPRMEQDEIDEEALELASMPPFERLQRGMDDFKCGVLLEKEYLDLKNEQLDRIISTAESEHLIGIDQSETKMDTVDSTTLPKDVDENVQKDSASVQSEDENEKQSESKVVQLFPHTFAVGQQVLYTRTEDEMAAAQHAAEQAYIAAYGTPEDIEARVAAAKEAAERVARLKNEIANDADEVDNENLKSNELAEAEKAFVVASEKANVPAIEKIPETVSAMVHAQEPVNVVEGTAKEDIAEASYTLLMTVVGFSLRFVCTDILTLSSPSCIYVCIRLRAK